MAEQKGSSYISGHAAVCLAMGCGWRVECVTPRMAVTNAQSHNRDTGHRTASEVRSQKVVAEGTVDAR